MVCEIGPADAADAPALARIAALTLREAWSEVAYRELLARPLCLAWTARGAPDGVVGFVVGRRVLDVVEVHSIGVAPAWQGRGLGGRLLDAFLGRARREGAVRVHLEVRESNAPARALYRGYGFRPEGRRRRYYADGEDALLLGAAL